jgi:hypothetical protein
MRTLWRGLLVLGLTLAYFGIDPATSQAGNQGRAGINLGLTSFFDGFGRPVEGFTYQAYFHYARARATYDAQGNESKAFVDPEFDIYLWLNQLSYTMPHTLFGGRARPGINFILPVLGYRTDIFTSTGRELKSNRTGIGDLTFGPTLQFLPIVVNGRPVFSHRFEVDLIVPTGKYDPDRQINQGSNYVSINPYWAATVLPLPGLELTARLNWIYNFTNERPVNPPVDNTVMPARPLAIESARAGQTFWLNYAASYEVVKTLHVGVNGYYLKQLTRDRFNQVKPPAGPGGHTSGAQFGEGKQQVFGVGPGIFWEAAKTEKVFVNAVFPTLIKTRWDHSFYQVRWIHSF